MLGYGALLVHHLLLTSRLIATPADSVRHVPADVKSPIFYLTFGAPGRIRTSEGLRRVVYSHDVLTTYLPTRQVHFYEPSKVFRICRLYLFEETVDVSLTCKVDATRTYLRWRIS